MRTFCFGFLITLALIPTCFAQQDVKRPDTTPKSLPVVSLDCYASYGTVVGLAPAAYDEIAIDGDNFEKPIPRYRLHVVDNSVLKIIRDPARSALRKEVGKYASEMTRDFTNKHQIVGWKEDVPGGRDLYTVNFDDRLFSVVEIRTAMAKTVTLHVYQCKPSAVAPKAE
ncbi:hypothetical protein [Afipia sp. GAS231]|uniref:hypothetical protein n=1 Tax=Afipia sp. GAS231 TaxID=1882747 RepID=UPI0012F9798B|nr:hypothetical protein [Afipia sp. GAS231]